MSPPPPENVLRYNVISEVSLSDLLGRQLALVELNNSEVFFICSRERSNVGICYFLTTFSLLRRKINVNPGMGTRQ